MSGVSVEIHPPSTDALLFDLDGVITRTARLHAQAWKMVFDEVLKERSRASGEPFESFDERDEYVRYVDGKPRLEGARAFFASRGIALPEDNEEAEKGDWTLAGVAEAKNECFLTVLNEEGPIVYPDAVTLLDQAREVGLSVGLFSASRNAKRVLEAAGLSGSFDAVVDGKEAAGLGLAGKPAPDTIQELCDRLGASSGRSFVFEDSQAGVNAASEGGFRVVGVDRGEDEKRLDDYGADWVVSSLDEVELLPAKRASALPSALEATGLFENAQEREVLLFLDFDGTLSPIVEHHADAHLLDGMRVVIERLTDLCPVAVVSGRDVEDVMERVGVDGVCFAGSHGFDVVFPDGERFSPLEGEGFQDALSSAVEMLKQGLSGVEGARIEVKRFSVAVHDRSVPGEDRERVTDVVDAVDRSFPLLEVRYGKRVRELVPGVDWDKGAAVGVLREHLEEVPGEGWGVYVGDDLTDEDAFLALKEDAGTGVVVGAGDRLTFASFALEDPEEVRSFLEALGDALVEASA